MSRLYFHLHDGVDVLLDNDGVDISPGDAAKRALHEARALIAHEAIQARIDLRQRIDVEDADGAVICTVAFGDAVTIIQAA